MLSVRDEARGWREVRQACWKNEDYFVGSQILVVPSSERPNKAARLINDPRAAWTEELSQRFILDTDEFCVCRGEEK